jgi:hypothetical protein
MTTPATPPPTLASELRGSSVRMLVAFGSLSAGQVALGERDPGHVIRRAAVGAALTEVTPHVLRWVSQWFDLNAPLDATILASYGPVELERLYALVQTALLQNRRGP